MKNIRSLVLGVALSLGVFPSLVNAQVTGGKCIPTISTDSEWVLRYGDGIGSESLKVFTASVTNSGSSACTGHFRIVPIDDIPSLERNNSLETIPFTVSNSNINNIVATSTQPKLSGATLQVQSNGNGEQTTFGFRILPPNLIEAGRYTKSVELQYVSANGKEVMASRPLLLVADVISTASIGLRGEWKRVGGVPTVDLGELQSGIRQTNAFVYVEASRGYSMTVTSLNAGKLKHDLPGWEIDYGLRLGGVTINLAAPYDITVPPPGAKKDIYRMEFSIGDVEGKRAGQYSDTLRFTVSAI